MEPVAVSNVLARLTVSRMTTGVYVIMQRLFKILVLSTVIALVMAACGEAAAPTATAPAPMPTAADTVMASPTPSAAAGGDGSLPAVSGYPPERVKEMLAQSMYLATMQYGKGETPQYGGTAVYSNKADPQTDDPMLTGSITVRNVFGAVTGDGGLDCPALHVRPSDNGPPHTSFNGP